MTSASWWQATTIYQIYPRSFCDASGDGVGDLRGIIAHIPYFASLGIGAVWISPFYPSPMKDFGYDISDYCGIDPLFGTMDDFDALIAALHESGLRLILDLVPNHTSDQHPWFRDARASRDSRKRDWYIWRDPAKDGGPPNNWLSEFGGSAWEFDAASGQYYYHAFLASQPDLNWRNPAVRAAMHEVMRFWLRKGVDGFRVDVMWHLMKDEAFRDNPPNPDYDESRPPHERLLTVHSADVDDVHEVVRGLRHVIDEFDDRLLIGEIYLPFPRLVTYYGAALDGAHLPFNFALLRAPWTAEAIARIVIAYEAALPPGAWPNWVLGNHDRPRVASRVGEAQARVAAMLLLTLRGTPTLYYGDEIALPQVAIPPERIRDPFEINVPGKGVGRDGARTPMQWTDEAFAGFSHVAPWLPLSDDWHTRNVAVQSADAQSMLTLTRKLLALRERSPALRQGAIRDVTAHGDGSEGGALTFIREQDGERLLVALNFGASSLTLDVNETIGTEADGAQMVIALSTSLDRENERIGPTLTLCANEGVIVRLPQ
jgi:alpha-glucosidase